MGQESMDEAIAVRPTKDWWVRGATVCVVLAWLSWLVYGVARSLASQSGATTTLERLGQFGDMFGALNALFTALAFVAVWWTGRMQREELILQRNELKLQRAELADTRSTISRQTFESMFFQTLALARELQDSLYIRVQIGEPYRGQEAMRRFARIAEEFPSMLPNPVLTGTDNNALKENLGKLFSARIYSEQEDTLGPYFRTLYQIFKLIDGQAGLSEEARRQYAGLARAQLNSNELMVLALNGCTLNGEGFRAYIEKYALLKHYPKSATKALVVRCYGHEAFL